MDDNSNQPDYLTGLRKHIEEVRESNIEYKEYLKESRDKLAKILNADTKNQNNVNTEECVVINLSDYINERK
jgi:hypothetical protein